MKVLSQKCTMGRGRQIAFEHSSGDLIMVIDTDTVYYPIFKDFVKQADNVEAELRRLIARQLRSFQIVQIVLIGLCLSVTVIIGIAFGRFVRRRMAHERELGAAYEQLHRSEQKFRYIAEQSIVGLIITQDGRFKYVNQAASEILEYPAEEILNWGVVVERISKGESGPASPMPTFPPLSIINLIVPDSLAVNTA